MINKYNLKIKDFVSDNYGKPEICGVLINPKESVATDGISLIRVQNPDFNLEDYPKIPNEKIVKDIKPFILPKEDAEKILKNLPKNKNLLILENAIVIKQNKESVEIASTDLSSIVKTKSNVIQGQYPDYKQILPKKGKYIKIKVNGKFLKRIVNFLNDFNDNRLNEIEIEVPIENKTPIRFYGEREETKQKCEILLMPIKEA